MTGQLNLFPPEMEQDKAFLNGLNAQQRAAVEAPAGQGLQVLAGAGTGKTELISRRFVKLVRDLRQQGIARPEERILVVTFTSDAALNMRARIHHRLVENGEEGLGPNAWISTFHQFCMRILRTHALDAGLPPDFTMLNTLEQQVLFQRMMQGILAGEELKLSQALAEHQLDLPEDTLCLKRLMALNIADLESLLEPERMYRLINRIKTAGLSPREFLELATRQSEQFTECLKSMPVPHSKELDKLENVELKIAAWHNHLKPWAYAGWDPLQVATEKAECAGKKLTPGALKDELKALAKLYLVDRSFEPANPDFSLLDLALTQEREMIQIVAAIYALYQKALLLQGACDFDDLINHVIRLLSTRPHLQKRYQRQFESIIVDEFQDSNGSQLRLLELLVKDGAQNLTVVGDEKQSIYAFRFAQPENLDLVFRNGTPNRINLQINYRSRPPVLKVANSLTGQITDRPNQTLEPCENNAAHTAPLVTWVDLDEMLEADDGKLSHKPIYEQKEREARYIAAEIAQLVHSGEASFSDIAILVKSHVKAEEIQRALVELGIPSIRQKNLGFFQEAEIKDAMALLRLMHNLHDELSLVRILQKKLNQKQLLTLMQAKHRLQAGGQQHISLFDVCLHLHEHPHFIEEFPLPYAQAVGDLAAQLKALYRLKNRLSPVHLFLKLADQIGLIDRGTPEWQKKQKRITLRTFEKLLYLFSQSKTLQPTLEEVLSILEQYALNPNEELPVKEELSGEDAVQIMTVFASKGLEFKVVFAAYTEKATVNRAEDTAVLFDPQYAGKAGFGLILGKVNGLANLKREVYQKCWQTPRGKTEAQRVFYVALTRAMERLYVIRGSQSPAWTSPDEFPRSAIQRISETDDASWLEESYWNIDVAAIRQEMIDLQERQRLTLK
jgi:superfamily I DNA/RNA helicase